MRCVQQAVIAHREEHRTVIRDNISGIVLHVLGIPVSTERHYEYILCEGQKAMGGDQVKEIRPFVSLRKTHVPTAYSQKMPSQVS